MRKLPLQLAQLLLLGSLVALGAGCANRTFSRYEAPETMLSNSPVESGDVDEYSIWMRVAVQAVYGLSAATRNVAAAPTYATNDKLIANIRKNYLSYFCIEEQVLENVLHGAAIPEPADRVRPSLGPSSYYLFKMILSDATYLAWCQATSCDPAIWLSQVFRLRGLVTSAGLRQMFDTDSLSREIEGLLESELPAMVKGTRLSMLNARLRISPHILKFLDQEEPQWTGAELFIYLKYGKALRPFLVDPRRADLSDDSTVPAQED